MTSDWLLLGFLLLFHLTAVAIYKAIIILSGTGTPLLDSLYPHQMCIWRASKRHRAAVATVAYVTSSALCILAFSSMQFSISKLNAL
jgi:hypothetical protein